MSTTTNINAEAEFFFDLEDSNDNLQGTFTMTGEGAFSVESFNDNFVYTEDRPPQIRYTGSNPNNLQLNEVVVVLDTVIVFTPTFAGP